MFGCKFKIRKLLILVEMLPSFDKWVRRAKSRDVSISSSGLCRIDNRPAHTSCYQKAQLYEDRGG
jgi:hypothetical protein